MTKTHHITHSDVFLRSRSHPSHARDVAAAEQLLAAQRVAQDAFIALFDDIEDFDALVRDCVPTLEVGPVVRRERGNADRSRFARGKPGTRARGSSRSNPALDGPASSRR